jgi:hypothetical protein
MNHVPMAKRHGNSWAVHALCGRCKKPIWHQLANPVECWTTIAEGEVNCK